MTTFYAPHSPNPEYLTEIVKLMRLRGAPKLYANWRKGAWYALEGSHRSAAANLLRFTPIICPVTRASKIKHDTPQVFTNKVSEILDYYDDMRWWAKYDFLDLLPGPIRIPRKR